MNDLINFIESFWQKYDSQKKKASGFLQKLSSDVDCNMFIGYSEHGNRCLFLFSEELDIDLIEYEKTNISLIVSKKNKLIYIELNDLYFAEIFNDLIFSIFNKINKANLVERTRLFLLLFRKWNELFISRANNSLLTEKELIGLIGELSFLDNQITTDVDGLFVDSLLEAWTGPDNKANDFVFIDRCVEIKVIEIQKNYIDISSEYQLSEVDRPIYLHLYRYSYSTKGISLIELITQIRLKIDLKFGDIEKFLYKLNTFGIDFKNVSLYNDKKVLLSDFTCYDTSLESFPKIIPEHLTFGIFSVKYKLSISQLTPFKIFE